LNEKDKIQLAYLSFATRSLKSNCDEEIQKILEESRKHNAEKDITGQLIYRGGIFLQLLEGGKDDVSLLLGRILLDSQRHENIKILFNQPMTKRVFPNWSMAYKYLDDTALDIVNSIVPWQKLTDLSAQKKSVGSDAIMSVFEGLAV